jgi:hypothetical protein
MMNGCLNNSATICLVKDLPPKEVPKCPDFYGTWFPHFSHNLIIGTRPKSLLVVTSYLSKIYFSTLLGISRAFSLYAFDKYFVKISPICATYPSNLSLFYCISLTLLNCG